MLQDAEADATTSPPSQSFHGNRYLPVETAHLSNHHGLFLYMEIARLSRCTAEEVIMHTKSIFARHGIPEVVISDNGLMSMQTLPDLIISNM